MIFFQFNEINIYIFFQLENYFASLKNPKLRVSLSVQQFSGALTYIFSQTYKMWFISTGRARGS